MSHTDAYAIAEFDPQTHESLYVIYYKITLHLYSAHMSCLRHGMIASSKLGGENSVPNAGK